MQVLDYSSGYPRATIVKQRYVGVMRYLQKEGTSKVKPLTIGEYRDMTTQGLGVGLIGEHLNPARALDGYDAGRHDALWWVSRAELIGVSILRSVYLTVDFDANPDDILHYYEGARTVLHNATGGYGSFRVLQSLFDRGLIDWGMQTYAWSRGHNIDPKTYEPRAHLFQRLDRATVDGVDCDVSDVLHEDWGAVNLDPPLPNIQEDEMIITNGTWPNSRTGILSGGRLIDITDDERARDMAQHEIDVGRQSEITVTDETWDRMAAAPTQP